MRVLESLDGFPSELRGGAVSIGNFDGVHRGHASIIQRLVEQARRNGGPAIALTFEPHPARLLRPDLAPPTLTPLPRKLELLEALELDAALVCPTRPELLELTADEFFQRVLIDQLGARGMVEGPNFLFGRRRSGDIQRLSELCSAAQVELAIVPPLEHDGEIISSSRVRRLLDDGNVDAANALLTEPYRVSGVVRPGAQRGSRIGFPTANLHELQALTPGTGVYAGTAWVDERRFPAAIHIGPNPTFGEGALKLEVHLPGWEGPLYGQVLAVDIVSRLRDIHPFPSVDALVAQLRLDVAEAQRRFDQAPPTRVPRSHHGA